MKKIFVILIALTMVLTGTLVLASCSGRGSGNEDQDPAKEEEQTESKEQSNKEEKGDDPENSGTDKGDGEKEEEKKVTTDNITINTQSSIRIEGSSTIYIDPYKITKARNDADFVFITHAHYDHFDKASLDNVMNDRTIVICPESLERDVRKAVGSEVSALAPGSGLAYEKAGLKAEAFPAYNVNKSYHPKENEWLSYLIEMDGIKYYDEGDTDAIDEHGDVECDILFLPIGGTYTMTAEEAAEDANRIAPKIAVPIHYGSIVGSKSDVDTFKAGLNGDIKVVEKVEDAR